MRKNRKFEAKSTSKNRLVASSIFVLFLVESHPIMQKLVVFSGAGISAESGLKTFRDSDGLWENYNIMEVATPEAWQKDPALVLEFYNKRRKQVLEAVPNDAHQSLVDLESKYDVQIITQNIDDLHERAGSSKVLHLHGEVTKARGNDYPDVLYPMDDRELKLGDTCDKGSQLRPHVVWFGEAVPNMEIAHQMIAEAELLIVVGTSLNVYPAAGLVHYSSYKCRKFLVDPKDVKVTDIENLEVIKDKASVGVPFLVKRLLAYT